MNININAAQERAVKEWAADDRLWKSQESAEFNLRTFARVILKLHTASEVIREEAAECAKSAEDTRNTPQHRDIFYVVSIVLNGIADRLEGHRG